MNSNTGYRVLMGAMEEAISEALRATYMQMFSLPMDQLGIIIASRIGIYGKERAQ